MSRNSEECTIPKKLELGCGERKPNGYYGVDIADFGPVDLVQDLDEPNWDLPSNHFDRIRAIDVFEHLDEPTRFIEEVWRIATPESTITIRGPHFSSDNWHDPTHKRLLGSRTFNRYTSEGVGPYADGANFATYSECEFRVVDYEIQFQWQSFPLSQLGYLFSNQFTHTYETTLLRNVLPATNIEFTLSPEKT